VNERCSFSALKPDFAFIFKLQIDREFLPLFSQDFFFTFWPRNICRIMNKALSCVIGGDNAAVTDVEVYSVLAGHCE